MIDDLWRRYARVWSLEGAERDAELRACLDDGVAYADPNISLAGIAPFAAYMDGFRASFPGHAFRIHAVAAHHGGSLARWDLVDSHGALVFPGLSFGLFTADGRFQKLHGFFGGLEALLQ
ncbi:MAG TPA: nuclear transport factor 2 family protein [Holophagaceae bacterium]|nr:nuclear transport factor 2 family protein [Holophagaceae bacterium]